MIISCKKDNTRQLSSDTKNISLFSQLTSNSTNLDFINEIKETTEFNTFTYDGFLQGAGVGILDVDNDGLQDIYFASSSGNDKLYRNKGNLKFEDISEKAGIQKGVYFSSGITIVDINQDGYDDIYVNRFLYTEVEKLKNKLYVNQKDGTFKEEASTYGIDDPGLSTCATFFDMDGDNDLDLYVGNQPPNDIFNKQKLKNKVALYYTDNLYRNDNSKFTKITQTAGIENYNYTLSVNPIDYDEDGDIDLFVASDYAEPDYLYTNDGKGNFTNKANEAFRHISNFAMGADIADINNDGLLDIFCVDMVAEDNFRQKTNMSGMNPKKFWALANNGYHHQYMFNALQLNNGNGMFSEIAQMAGISNTDWSWAPLFIDIDHDGNQDLFITNGVYREVRNKDYEIWRTGYFEEKQKEQMAKGLKDLPYDPIEVASKAPSIKLPNFAYKNNGDMTFEKVSDNWNFSEPSWSSGSAYADFDNDGDLDMVINNTNMPCFFYENKANDKNLNNYAIFKLQGPFANPKGFGASIQLKYGNKIQKTQINPYRGYMSSSEAIAQVGLGEIGVIDEVKIIWPDGKVATYNQVEANKTITFKYTDAKEMNQASKASLQFQAYDPGTEIRHVENEYDDYLNEVLLPHKMSTLGPVVAIADINNDGNDDFFVGGSADNEGKLYLGKTGGKFELSNQSIFLKDKNYEDSDALFFDADGDQDMDLYVGSGGNEFPAGSDMYQDRLYINNNGQYTVSKLPPMTGSTGAIAAADYDSDGDIDLFVGSRQVPGKYGFTPLSYFLKNEKGVFSIAQEIEMGMVTDASFSDVNNDKKLELITSGEWSPIQIWDFENATWAISKTANQLEKTNGWWNTIRIEDIDNDGDLDVLAGNLGLNLKFKASQEQAFKLYVDDFDKNGSNDVYLGYYARDGKCYPVRGRQCSSEQMPFVKEEFKTYNDFGSATIDDVLKDKVDGNTVKAEVYNFKSAIFENDGTGKFTFVALDNKAQMAPINGFAILDVNKDGKKDFIAAGNYYNREVETTRSDAGTGVVAISKGGNQFEYMPVKNSGLNCYKDVRAIHELKSGNETIVAVFNNNDKAEFYKLN